MRPRHRIVLSGGTGFLGRSLIERFRSLGMDPIALVRTPAQRDLLNCESILIESDGQVIEAITDASPGVVMHIAAHGGVQSDISEIGDIVRANITLGTLLMQAAADSATSTFLGIGSFSQRSVSNGIVHPNSLYAASKSALESFGSYYGGARGLRCTFLQPSDVYGPLDTRGRLLSLLVSAARTGQGLGVTGGAQVVSFVHVDDVIDAILHVTVGQPPDDARVRSPESYGICGPEVLTLRDTVALIERDLDVQIPVEWGARPYRTNEVLEPDFLNPPPSWAPSRGVVQGFKQLLEQCS